MRLNKVYKGSLALTELIPEEGLCIRNKKTGTIFEAKVTLGWIHYRFGQQLANPIPESPDDYEEGQTINLDGDEVWLPLTEYGEAVDTLIRHRYNVSQEMSILRQRDTKPDEFNTYNDYCERCKTLVKEYLKKGT